VTNHLSNQLNTFLRPSVEDELYSSVHGPANILRQRRLGVTGADVVSLVDTVPVDVRVPVVAASLPGPGFQLAWLSPFD
jgi:hypothetical protein